MLKKNNQTTQLMASHAMMQHLEEECYQMDILHGSHQHLVQLRFAAAEEISMTCDKLHEQYKRSWCRRCEYD